MMAQALMMLGTHSSAGKSLLATAFCRIFARRGLRVAPFKAQNMSNNAGVTPEGGEMGRAQIVQAEAAGIYAHTDMNPVLLKPEGNRRSQVVLNGKIDGRIEAGNWMKTKGRLWGEVTAAYDRLSSRYDVVVLEGAGSPAEINLKAGDIVNLRMARHAGASCLLVGDIDRGGVFAALAGTMLLLEPEERLQIGGFLVNRFRGDPALLGDGLEMLRQRAFGVPTLGVIPYLPDLRIADEDAVPLERDRSSAAPQAEGQLDVAVIHLPRIANFDEFDALELEPENSRAGAYLAEVYNSLDQPERAELLLEDLLEADPDSAEAIRARGLVRWNRNDFAGALEDFKTAYRLADNMNLIAIDIAIIEKDLGNVETAKEFLQQVIDADPYNPHALFRLGEIAVSFEGNPAQALRHLQDCVDLNPDYIHCRFMLGRAQERLGSIDDAAASFEKAIELGSLNPQHYFWAGFSQIQLGNCSRALAYLEPGLRLALETTTQRFAADIEDVIPQCDPSFIGRAALEGA